MFENTSHLQFLDFLESTFNKGGARVGLKEKANEC